MERIPPPRCSLGMAFPGVLVRVDEDRCLGRQPLRSEQVQRKLFSEDGDKKRQLGILLQQPLSRCALKMLADLVWNSATAAGLRGHNGANVKVAVAPCDFVRANIVHLARQFDSPEQHVPNAL